MKPQSQGEPASSQGNQDTEHGGGKGDGGENEHPRQAAEVAGALGRRAHQDVHRGQQQAQQVEGQGEQRREDRQVHRCLSAEGLRHGQHQHQQQLRAQTHSCRRVHV